MRTAISHSSSSSVAASPVDPQATRKSMPESICQFTSAQRRLIDRSIRPKGRNDCCTATCSFHTMGTSAKPKMANAAASTCVWPPAEKRRSTR
jgi:hypothetical protein